MKILLLKKTCLSVRGSRLGLDTVKMYWYRYNFKEYHIVLSHSFKVLLTVLSNVKLSFIRDCPGSSNRTIHNKIYNAINL